MGTFGNVALPPLEQVEILIKEKGSVSTLVGLVTSVEVRKLPANPLQKEVHITMIVDNTIQYEDTSRLTPDTKIMSELKKQKLNVVDRRSVELEGE